MLLAPLPDCLDILLFVEGLVASLLRSAIHYDICFVQKIIEHTLGLDALFVEGIHELFGCSIELVSILHCIEGLEGRSPLNYAHYLHVVLGCDRIGHAFANRTISINSNFDSYVNTV